MQLEFTQGWGLCECGCGQRTNTAPCTDASKGWHRGQPKRFVFGHRMPRAVDFLAEDRGYVTPCLIWQGPLKNGYGITDQGKRVHRKVYEKRFGRIPSGLEPDHLCKIKACANPNHLELVTHTENVRRGPHTKLTMEQADEIRQLAVAGWSNTKIAAQFGCLRQTVRLIVCGKQWVH